MASSDYREHRGSMAAGLARTSCQLPAAVGDTPHPAVISHFGVLDVLSSTTPRPSDRKPNWARRLADLATKVGEKCGLARSALAIRGAAVELGLDRIVYQAVQSDVLYQGGRAWPNTSFQRTRARGGRGPCPLNSGG